MLDKTFFIADTHFGHEQIIRFENRPFQDARHMNDILVANWNKAVSPQDRVFILGDFALGEQASIIELILRLNGYKILILGNHDRELSYTWWQQSGFDEVVNYPIIYQDWFILSHEPLYINKNMPYTNIFGHVHANPAYADYTRQSFCVSVERINYTPIEFKDMLEKMKSFNELGDNGR